MREKFNLEQYLERLEKSESILMCEAVPVADIKENQNYIFISYAHADYKKVYADLAVMYHAGVRFWYDRGLKAGKNWDSEVKERILSPNCCGVIFFISESLFLSKSANMEIDLVCGEDGVRKNYFCVNLSEEQPKGILKTIMRMDDQVLDNAGLDMDRIGTLARAFSDKQTFLFHFEAEHRTKLLEQIKDQFDVMDAGEKKSYALIDVENGEMIPILHDTFSIGKWEEKNHFVINDVTVSRVHAIISINGSECHIMDMGAGYGTYLDGEKIPPLSQVTLQENTVITFGKKSYKFVEK